MKVFLAKKWASKHCKNSNKWKSNAVEYQEKLLLNLIKSAENTTFGKAHNFNKIKSIKEYQAQVSVKEYETLKPYIEQVKQGKNDVLWNAKPMYFAKTSGTTSGAKYIPISKESMPYHIKAAKSALFHYIKNVKNADFVKGKMIFLQGSPEMTELNSISVGRLSGIVAHFVPKYLQKNRLPSFKTNCIEDWETKVDAIVEETKNENMTLISGIPPWIIMYFEKLLAVTQKNTISELFPNLQLLITGGVNYEPYRLKMNELLGESIDVLQTFPASEGFIAFQDTLDSEGLLLLANHGIFYEFIPLNEFHTGNYRRLTLGEVELHTDYVLIMTTNAGLWSYNIGDTVQFVSKKPYRIVVSGRIKHFTSAFGEHVIAYEIESALQETLVELPAKISEFTMAPQVNPVEGLPYHEWFIEFEEMPKDLAKFEAVLDQKLQTKNTYYNDLIDGKVLKPLQISVLKKGSFVSYMKQQGKLGGQNKVPRLANDRKIAEVLEGFVEG